MDRLACDSSSLHYGMDLPGVKPSEYNNIFCQTKNGVDNLYSNDALFGSIEMVASC